MYPLRYMLEAKLTVCRAERAWKRDGVMVPCNRLKLRSLRKTTQSYSIPQSRDELTAPLHSRHRRMTPQHNLRHSTREGPATRSCLPSWGLRSPSTADGERIPERCLKTIGSAAQTVLMCTTAPRPDASLAQLYSLSPASLDPSATDSAVRRKSTDFARGS